MPANFYKALLPEDLDAIIAYLHTIKPIRNQVTDPVYKAPVHRDPYPRRRGRIQQGDVLRSGTAWRLSRHHRPLPWNVTSTRTRGISDFRNGLGRGGRDFPPLPGSPEGTPPSIAANITSDQTAGIGAWTDQEIVRAITRGIARDGRMLKQPMAFGYYARLSPSDLADIVAYLRTVPPLQ